MKRIILLIGAILLGLAARAQSVTYTCRYWFDQNHAQAVTTTFGENGWEAELDVGNLTDGIHALHLHVLAADTVSVLGIENDSLYHAADTTLMKWSSPQSFLFMKVSDTPSADLEYRYWFDQDYSAVQSGSVGTGFMLLDVAHLEEGLHVLHVMLKGTEYTAAQSYLFLKMDAWEQGTPNYVYHCWFDEDYANQQSDSLGGGHLLLDVNGLDEGMHSVHVMVEGSTLTATQNYLFMKVAPFSADTLDMTHLAYHCWFDQDFEHRVTDSLGNGNLLLDVGSLDEGIHSVHVLLEGSTLTATQSYLFMKVAPMAADTLDMTHLAYHCWFDQEFERRVTDSLGNGNLLLDVGSLDDGLHTVHVLLEGSTLTATQSYLFMKMAVEDPTTELQYICWFDQDYSNVQTGLVGSGLVDLDVADLPNGIHTVNVQLDNGTRTAPQTYLFYKQPLGGYGVARWEYWINDNWDERSTTILSASVDTLDIVTLLPVGHPALRSSCFHFHPNGEEPYINAKNQISFRIWDAEMRFMDMTRFYVDEQVQQDIVAQVFERNTTETFAAPRDNQIQWFKLDAVVGDSLSFIASKACTMQLFAPSGEEVFNVSGPESIILKGLHAWEDGTYYLAVHDQTGSGETLSVTYNWVYRYAILAYDVHLVGNGGCSTITFNGNGYNSLLDVYLVNAQNDTIRRIDIGHESNATTTVTFNFYGVNLGMYDAVFEFYDETMIVNNALEVQEPIDIVLTSTVNYPSTYLRSQGIVTYTYTVTNNGNMTAYVVPIYMYVKTASMDCISHLEIEGLDIMPLTDYFDLDSLSQNEIEELREWSNEMGDDHVFFKVYDTVATTGAVSLIRSGYFFIDLAPYETRTVKLKITSTCSVDTWVTIPSSVGPGGYYVDPYPPLTYDPNDPNDPNNPNNPNGNNSGGGSGSGGSGSGGSGTGSGGSGSGGSGTGSGGSGSGGSGSGGSGSGGSGSGGSGTGSGGSGSGGSGTGGSSGSSSSSLYCCAQEKIQCTFNIVCDALSAGSLIPGGWGAGLGVASCVCGILNEANEQFSRVICQDGGDDDYWDALKAIRRGRSVGGTIVSCIKAKNPVGKFGDFINMASHLLSGMSLGDLGHEFSDCKEVWKRVKPDCPPGDPKGGTSRPVVPVDPNDIYGYLSESGSHYMRQEIQNVQYEIEFENDTTLATAAAHTIIVCDTLDATKFDLNSLAARSVTIGDKRLELNGEQTFARTLDLRPEIYVIAQIEQDYDPTTGIVEWTIQSLDPMTMEPTDDPNQGVLPVNYNGNGVGFIDYSIDLKEAFADGTEISNRAGIIFDQNEVIMTPTWTNTVDAVKPTSHIEEVTPVADSLSFSFVSEDNRSGVWYHSLYYRNDSTDMQWQVKKPQITENSLMLFFDDFQTTEYLVMAVDSAGNVEEKEMVAEYTYYYEGPGPASQTNLLTQGWNWWSTYVEMNNVDGLGMLQNSLGHNGLTIKSQNDFTDNYYQDMGEDYWYGSLESIHNEQGYLINVADACSVTMTGSAAIPALHPITIQPNWNWIGYPVAVPQTVANALSGFNPMPDDVVKGQSDFTSYYEGFGWYPDDFMLVPGQSYLYFSNANAGNTLTYASGSRGGALKSRKLGATYWNNNVHAYADNLSVMAVVKVDSVEQRDEHLELGAFVNGECRGSVRLRYFAPLDRYYAMLTVSGQDGDLVGFRLIHSESLEENETCGNHLVFSKNAIVGSLGKPYEIRFGEAEDAMVDMVLYPNPVERGATFSLMIPSGETVTEVIITDVVGNQLRHETGAINAKSIKGLPTAGVYVIKAVAKSGNTYHGRLIVE